MGTKIAELGPEAELLELREQSKQLDERLRVAEAEHGRTWNALVELVGERTALDARVQLVRSELAKAGRAEPPTPEQVAAIEIAILAKLPKPGPEHPRDAEWESANRVIQLVARELGAAVEMIQRVAGDLGRLGKLHERVQPSMGGNVMQWADAEVVRVRRAAKLAASPVAKPIDSARVHGPSSYNGPG